MVTIILFCMGFIELFFKDKKEIKANDIRLFMSQRTEENVNLDYKDVRAYNNADDLAIHVSSFANSEGGLIILGMSQDEIQDEKGKIVKIYPKDITWGEVSFNKESLENKLVSRIRPAISGLVIRPVRNENDEVIFLIDIPKSNRAPHMAYDYKYHKRMNFGTCAMEHYEVANLFRINWTMKEKLVEKIYDPLSSVLEKHAKQLAEFTCPPSGDFEEILSKTYYKIQMPSELLERIDYYIDQLKELDRKEHFARRAMNYIVTKNNLEYIHRASPPLNNELKLNLKAVSEKFHFDLYSQIIYQLLLTNQKIQTYLSKVYWRYSFEKIQVTYSDSAWTVNLDEFDELVWKKCLKEASENAEVIEMKKSVEVLSEEAWDLIEQITRY
jgi:hypothetical protein